MSRHAALGHPPLSRQGHDDCLRAAVNAKLSEDQRELVANGFLALSQTQRDRAVIEPLGDKVEDDCLGWRQAGFVDSARLLRPVLPEKLGEFGVEYPPRRFAGQEHVLVGPCFTLGRHGACDLVFDSTQYPVVSARHCEILFDRRNYTLHDHSRNGTLVNEQRVNGQVLLRPGDWIRLGPGGPLVRFLGRAITEHGLRIVE